MLELELICWSVDTTQRGEEMRRPLQSWSLTLRLADQPTDGTSVLWWWESTEKIKSIQQQLVSLSSGSWLLVELQYWTESRQQDDAKPEPSSTKIKTCHCSFIIHSHVHYSSPAPHSPHTCSLLPHSPGNFLVFVPLHRQLHTYQLCRDSWTFQLCCYRRILMLPSYFQLSLLFYGSTPAIAGTGGIMTLRCLCIRPILVNVISKKRLEEFRSDVCKFPAPVCCSQYLEASHWFGLFYRC